MAEYKYEIIVDSNVAKLIITPLPPEDELESFLERLKQVIATEFEKALLEFIEQEFEQLLIGGVGQSRFMI